jgi:transcriptional regulator with XRE-family HTH domain
MNHTTEIPAIDRIEQVQDAPIGFGERLRLVRLALGLKQLDVEDLSWGIAKREGSYTFRVSNSRLSAIEHGHAFPGPAKLLALGEIYGLTLEQLIKLWASIAPQPRFKSGG